MLALVALSGLLLPVLASTLEADPGTAPASGLGEGEAASADSTWHLPGRPGARSELRSDSWRSGKVVMLVAVLALAARLARPTIRYACRRASNGTAPSSWSDDRIRTRAPPALLVA